MRRLAQADRLLGEGKDVADVCRVLQVSEQTATADAISSVGLKADDAAAEKISSGRTPH